MNAFVIVTGKFDNVGIASGLVDENMGRVRALRLHVHSESSNWAILSEVRTIFICSLVFR